MALRKNQLKTYSSFLDEHLRGRHLSKLCQFNEDAFAFSLSKGGKLVFVLSGDDPRVYLSPSLGDGTSFSSPFSSILRKTLSNAVMEKVELYGDDRILRFSLLGVNEVYKPTTYQLIAELIPAKPNLILLEEGKVLGAYKTNTLSDARPILRGVNYVIPPKKEGFASIKEEDPAFSPEEYTGRCVEKESSLVDRRKKQRFLPLFRYLKTREKALIRKIDLLEKDSEEAKKHLEDGKYGDYIFMNYSAFSKGDDHFLYEGERVALDPRKNPSLNAETFYKRAKKAKATLLLGEENRKKAEKELSEIRQLSSVLLTSDEDFLLKAEKEYGLDGILDKGIKATPLSDSSLLPMEARIDGVRYLFGKNAKQNDFLSFAYATNKDYLWFHVKEAHGAHLIIQKENPSDQEIGMGCQIALLASKKEDGEVMYCPKKNVRRGNVPGQALVKEYRSATFRKIDPKARQAFLEAKKVSS